MLRCRLQLISMYMTVTCFHLLGVSVAVKGVEHQNNPGHFAVEDVCYPKLEILAEPSCNDNV